MNSELVSVCLPLYNAGSYVEETVRSVLAQTYLSWELILVDDNSSDDTAAVVERVVAQASDARIRFAVNAQRLGMVGNWNHAVGLARGKFIKLIGQDDLLAPDCLEVQAAVLRQYPNINVVTCALQVIGPTGRKILLRQRLPREGQFDGAEMIERCLRTGTNTIGEPVAVLFRSDTLGQRDLFESTITYCTDLDLWLRLLAHGDLYYIAEPKGSYRIHQQAATRALEGEVVTDFFRVVDRVTASGRFHVSALQRMWLAVKVRALLLVRTSIYSLLARR